MSHAVSEPAKDAFEVAGRGELQLGVLIETMRREGFELSISRPRVLFNRPKRASGWSRSRKSRDRRRRPYPASSSRSSAERKGEMQDMRPPAAPARCGSSSRADARPDRLSRRIPHRHARHRRHEPLFHGYAPFKGGDRRPRNGVLISTGEGEAVAYALWNLEERGPMLIEPGDQGLSGHDRRRARATTISTSTAQGQAAHQHPHASKDEAVRLTPPIP
jgi:GTP-binding protein